MKTLVIISLTFLFLAGCSQRTNIPTQANQNSKGSILLNIDKTNSPENVVEVEAFLTREGYDTLSASLNLVTDTTAEVTINDIAAGEWHLTVNALDDSSTVVYTGETDVTILADITTQVYLTLTPTGNGFGNIYIHVGWGHTPEWVDYESNPILSASDLPYFALCVSQAQVMLDNGQYKMWFTNLYYNGYADISYAESSDGINWQVPANNPVLTKGDPGSWDDYTVGMGFVLKEDGIYKFYYSGNQDPNYGMRQIGLATSTDGINWTKYPNPVLASNSSQYYLGVHSVIKINGTYYMYYDASPENDYSFTINLATSTDGINWTKYANNPILAPTESWEDGSIGYATVVQRDDGYKMIYANGLIHSGVGSAFSTDGINWTKDPANPVFKVSDVANGWCTQMSYPFSVMVGNDYRIYYSGIASDSWYHIGVAFWK